MIELTTKKGRVIKKMKMRIKSFVGQKERALDEKVNDWIKKNPAIEIVKIESSITTVSQHKIKILVTILYRFGN